MRHIFIILFLVLFTLALVNDNYILQHFVVVGATYEKCHHYGTPFGEIPSICTKKKVIAKKKGYIQYEVIESNSWIDHIGQVKAEKADYFYWYNERR